MCFIFLLGAIAFLIMVHPVIFFLLVLPLGIIFLLSFIRWLKK